MTKKKAYYSNYELIKMIEEKTETVEKIVEILSKQVSSGKNKTLFNMVGSYKNIKYDNIDPRILLVCKDIVNWNVVSKSDLPSNTIYELLPFLNLNILCTSVNGLLDDLDLFEKNIKLLNMATICRNKKVSKEFIDRFNDKIEFSILALNGKIELEYMIKYINRFNINIWFRNANSYNLRDSRLDIDYIISLINDDRLEFSTLINNIKYCSSELLKDIYDTNKFEFNNDRLITVLSKGYGDFIMYIKDYKFNDIQSLLFSEYGMDGNLLWKNQSNNVLAYFFDPKEHAQHLIDMLSTRQNSWSFKFLDTLEDYIVSVELAEKLCYQKALSIKMITKIYEYMASKNRSFLHCKNCIRMNNTEIIKIPITIELLNLVRFSISEFERLLKRIKNSDGIYGYTNVHTFLDYEKLINSFEAISKINHIEILKLKLKFYHNIYLSTKIVSEDDKIALKEFMIDYTKNMNEYPLSLYNDYGSSSKLLISMFPVDFIFDLIKNNTKLTNVYYIPRYYTLSIEQIRSLINMPISTTEKQLLVNYIFEYQIINKELFSEILKILNIKAVSTLQAINIANKNNLDIEFALLVIKDIDYAYYDYHLYSFIDYLYSGCNVSMKDILTYISKDYDISSRPNIDKFFSKADYTEEQWKDLLEIYLPLENQKLIGFCNVKKIKEKYWDNATVYSIDESYNTKFNVHINKIFEKEQKCIVDINNIIGINCSDEHFVVYTKLLNII